MLVDCCQRNPWLNRIHRKINTVGQVPEKHLLYPFNRIDEDA